MIAEFGLGALVIAFDLVLYASASAWIGAKQGKENWLASARIATLLSFPVTTIAALCLVYSLVNLDFNLEYVAMVSSRSMPPYLRATAFWGGQQGSLLFWAWLMSAFSFLVMLRDWR